MCSQAGVYFYSLLDSSQWSFRVVMIQTTVFLNRNLAKKQASKGKKKVKGRKIWKQDCHKGGGKMMGWRGV